MNKQPAVVAVTAVGHARQRWLRHVGCAVAASAATVVIIAAGGCDLNETATTGTPTTSGVSPITQGSTAIPAGPAQVVFGLQPLLPFTGAGQAAAWQDSYRHGGHQPWHLDPDQTALRFTGSSAHWAEGLADPPEG